MNRINHESLGTTAMIARHREFDSLFMESVSIEFVLSHRVGPLTLALIHLITHEADWKNAAGCLAVGEKQVWHTCNTLSLRNNKHTRWAVSLSVSLSNSLLLAGSNA